MSVSHLQRSSAQRGHSSRGINGPIDGSESPPRVTPAGEAFGVSGGSPPSRIEAAAPGPDGAGHGAGHGARHPRLKAGRRPHALDPESSVAPVLLTVAQAAQRLAVSPWTVRGWISSGRLKVVRLPGDGRLLRVELAALDALVASCRE